MKYLEPKIEREEFAHFVSGSYRPPIIKYCISKGILCRWDAIAENASNGGDLDTIKYCATKSSTINWQKVANFAAGRSDIIKYCDQHGELEWKYIASQVACLGSIEMLEYCKSKGVKKWELNISMDASVIKWITLETGTVRIGRRKPIEWHKKV